jgi:hypothetical protein
MTIMKSRPILMRRRVAIAAIVASSSIALFAATKGPDGGGYSATDEIVYSFVDISGASGGVSLLSGTDDGMAALTLPFAYRFYGQLYSSVCVSTNGALYFVPSAAACSGFDADFANTDVTAAPVPNDRPAALPFWSDLTFEVPGAGAVFYQTLGAAPVRRFVVQWHNAYPQGSSSAVTFQAILAEGGDRILFQYQNVALEAADPSHNGARATVGIRNAGSPANGQQLEWSFNAPVLVNDSAIAFSGGDSSAPIVTASAPATLWPPNGKTILVKVRGRITDSGSGIDLSSARFAVTDEYGVVQPTGPIAIAADGTYTVNVALVASRQGNDREGRRYSIAISANDHSGNVGSASTIVTVPHSQGH